MPTKCDLYDAYIKQSKTILCINTKIIIQSPRAVWNRHAENWSKICVFLQFPPASGRSRLLKIVSHNLLKRPFCFVCGRQVTRATEYSHYLMVQRLIRSKQSVNNQTNRAKPWAIISVFAKSSVSDNKCFCATTEKFKQKEGSAPDRRFGMNGLAIWTRNRDLIIGIIPPKSEGMAGMLPLILLI